LGTEPLSPVTQLYNQVVTRTLEPVGVSVRLIPRLEVEGEPVSASRVRALLGEAKDAIEDDASAAPGVTVSLV